MRFWDSKTVAVTGGTGFIGSHLCRKLRGLGAIVRNIDKRHADTNTYCHDLASAFGATRALARVCDVDILFHLAAKVGGITLNSRHGAEMFYENARINTATLEACCAVKVPVVIAVSSACVYASDAPDPIPESWGFVGDPEGNNYGYGWAKRMLEVQAEAINRETKRIGAGTRIWIARPTNAYGPGDNFNNHPHVIPALIQKALDPSTDTLQCLGTGNAVRSFLYVEDFVDGLMRLAECQPESNGHGGDAYNLTGPHASIRQIAEIILRACSPDKKLLFDPLGPDGHPRRVLDGRAAYGAMDFVPRVSIEDGIRRTVEWWTGQ